MTLMMISPMILGAGEPIQLIFYIFWKLIDARTEGKLEGVEALLKAMELLRQRLSVDVIAETMDISREMIENLQKANFALALQ